MLWKHLPQSKGWEGRLAPAALPKKLLVLWIVLSSLEAMQVASKVLVTSLATQRGQATFPDLEIERGACRVLRDLLGEAAGASHPS